MSISYAPISKLEADSVKLLAKGEYNFLVVECVEGIGPQCAYFNLKLELDSNHKKFIWYDRLIVSEGWQWKLRHACEEMRILGAYSSGKLEDSDFLKKRGILLIDHQLDKKDNILKAYVKDYGVRLGSTMPKISSIETKVHTKQSTMANIELPIDEQFNDDIPF